jgi:hypothetical protein
MVMLTMRPESFARGVAAVVVIGGHVLLIVLLSSSHPRRFNGAASSVPPRGTLILLELRPLPEQRSPAAPEPARAVVTAPRVPPGSPLEIDTAIRAPATPSIDWYREAEIVAREAAATPPARKGCDEAPRPGSLRPRCRKDPAEFLWDPEPRRFGLAGGIPYVRLGPCVLALIAFGCGIGKTEANGALFKDMRHPDRPTSSVPDVDEGDR